jgi:hypothetical protein
MYVKHVTHKTKTKASPSVVAAVLPPASCLAEKLCATEYSCLDYSPGLVRGDS